jgi:hypothetical protein
MPARRRRGSRLDLCPACTGRAVLAVLGTVLSRDPGRERQKPGAGGLSVSS